MKLVISLLTPLLIGFGGSMLTRSSVEIWYPFLTKPPATPPNWLFAPVWTVLYILIGTNLYLLWGKRQEQKISQETFKLYLFQLVLNGLWSPVFFGLRAPLAGLFIILPLWLTLLILMLRLRHKHRLNAGLILPYWLWVSLATYLNIGIVWLNPNLTFLNLFI